MYKLKYLLFSSFYILSQAISAQDSSLPLLSDSVQMSILLHEVVVESPTKLYKVSMPSTSLRLDGKLMDIPQNIQVLNQQVLADQQIYSMSDGITRNISGAARIEEWGDLYTYITMRGTRAASFRNGMNTSWKYGVLSEDMSFVERIEFVKGPAGFMMSNGEPSGIYNVVTKRPTGTRQGNFSLNMGSYGLYRAALDLDGAFDQAKNLKYRMNVVGQKNDAFRPNESTKRLGVAPVLSYQLGRNTKLTLEYIMQYALLPDLGISNQFSKTGYATTPHKQTLSDPSLESTKIIDQNITLNMQHNWTDNWKLTAQLSYFDYKQEGGFIWAKNVDEQGYLQRIRYIWDAKNEMSFGQLFVNGSFHTKKVNHKLLVGLDLSDKTYVADFSQSHLLDNIGTYSEMTDVYQKPYYGTGHFDRSKNLKERVGNSFLLGSSIMGLYVQDELGFWGDKLLLTLAGRYTYVKDNNFGVISENRRFTPRLGLNISIAKDMSMYALYDQSFLPQVGRKRNGNSLKPLLGNNFEVDFKKDWMDGRWNSALSVYHIRKKNQTSPDPDNIGGENYVLQFGETKTKGLELDIKGCLFRGFNVIANYAWTDSKITRSTQLYQKGTRVPGYAKHVLNTWLSYTLPSGILKDLSFSSGATYMADRATWWNGTHEGESLPNYIRWDGAISWKSGNLSLHLNVYNLTNRYLYNGAYHSSGWYYWRAESPRNYRLGLTYTF